MEKTKPKCKEIGSFREEYRDYGLLICQTDGRPVDPKNLEFSRRISRLSRACCRRIRLAEIRTRDTILVRLSPLLTNPTEL